MFRPKGPKRLHDYLLGGVIGKGSFGKVKEAVDLRTRERVAVKIIKERLLKKMPNGVESVCREIRFASYYGLVCHSQASRVWDFGPN